MFDNDNEGPGYPSTNVSGWCCVQCSSHDSDIGAAKTPPGIDDLTGNPCFLLTYVVYAHLHSSHAQRSPSWSHRGKADCVDDAT